ncbi:MAG: heparinase II/III family protein [Pseudomonadota bacterium]
MLYPKLIISALWGEDHRLDTSRIAQDYLPGDPDHGKRLMRMTPREAMTGDHWHSFAWLRDLRTVGGHEARRTGRQFTRAWRRELLRSPARTARAFTPQLVAVRLIYWVSHFEFFWDSAKPIDQKALMRLMVFHSQLLSLPDERALKSQDVFLYLRAALYIVIMRADGAPWSSSSIALLLTRAIKAQFFADGGHHSGSVQVQLSILLHLIDIENCMKRLQDPPITLDDSLRHLVSWLRIFVHRNISFADFHGNACPDFYAKIPRAIVPILIQAYGRGRIMRHAPLSGFARRSAGSLSLVYHAGKPAGQAHHHHAGSFELMMGRQRIMGNCAASVAGLTRAWRHALAGASGASQLCLEMIEPRIDHLVMTEPDPHQVGSQHDGFVSQTGLRTSRLIELSADGHELRGTDRLTPITPDAQSHKIMIRFHLDPSIHIHAAHDTYAILQINRRQFWLFSATGARLSHAPSVYIDNQSTHQQTRQLILSRFSYAAPLKADTLISWQFNRLEPSKAPPDHRS